MFALHSALRRSIVTILLLCALLSDIPNWLAILLLPTTVLFASRGYGSIFQLEIEFTAVRQSGHVFTILIPIIFYFCTSLHLPGWRSACEAALYPRVDVVCFGHFLHFGAFLL